MIDSHDSADAPIPAKTESSGDQPPEFRYHLFRTVISSQLEFQSWLPACGDPPEISFTLGDPGRGWWIDDEAWDYHLTDKVGIRWLSCAHHEEGYLLRKYGTGDFFVSRDGGSVQCIPVRDFDPWLVEQTFLYNVLARVLNLRGVDSIRAAAVKIGAGAVAFAGGSEAGKSTLAAHFLKNGFPLLTDEILVVDHTQHGVLGRPGIPELFLRADAVQLLNRQPEGRVEAEAPVEKTFKLEAALGEFWPDAAPLARIYIIEPKESIDPGQAATIDTPPGNWSFMKLMKLSYVMDPGDSVMLERQADLFTAIIGADLVRRLRVVRGFEMLPRIGDLILKDCGL